MRITILLSITFLLIDCAGPITYITPDYREFTTGGVYIEKYWTWGGGGKHVKIEGKFGRLSTEEISGREELVFTVYVPNGVSPINVYAKHKFGHELSKFKEGQKVTIAGEVIVISTTSKYDGRELGKRLAVELEMVQ